jgi:uncharacterized protein (TIGR03790 family)
VVGGLLISALAAAPDRRGEEVAVIYNRSGGEGSMLVAQHYAKLRNVPDGQVIGLDLPGKETITRAEFDEQFRKPLVAALVERGLVRFTTQIIPVQEGRPGRVRNLLQDSKIRYLVLCHGVPLKIAPDPNYTFPGQEKVPPQLRRNEAAVDSELAYLAQIESGLAVGGPNRNPQEGVKDASRLHPRNGVFLVSRLDGPTPEIAMGLVDKAIQAEQEGLWGRAWFDLRGLTQGNYMLGDNWIRTASELVRQAGYETVVDRAAAVFPDGFPMPQIALYAGWYTGSVSGPFKSDQVEFLPGAIAYHLHSFSARSVRSRNSAWVGPFLDRGVTATFGCVYEPYLMATPNVGLFFERLLQDGFTFGEAIYAAQNSLSWQVTVIGDPLYRPALHSFEELKVRLAGTRSEAAEWMLLQDLNRRMVRNALDERSAVAELEGNPLTRDSAILQQKLSELHARLRQRAEAVQACRRALDNEPSPEQKTHLQLSLARLCTAANRSEEAVEAYEQFFEDHPERPGLLAVYEEALLAAKVARRDGAAETFAREIERLTPPPVTPDPPAAEIEGEGE